MTVTAIQAVTARPRLAPYTAASGDIVLPGCYGVSRGQAITGDLIRHATGSRPSHAFIYVGNGRIVEVAPPAVRIAPAASHPDAIWNAQCSPTAAQRQGNFTELLGAQTGTDALGRPIFKGEIYDPSTTRPDGHGGFIRDPYTYNGQLNVMNPALISPVSLNFLKHMALPTTSGTSNNWVGPSKQYRVDKDQLYAKFDQIINDRHRFSFAWERLMPWFIQNKGVRTGLSGHAFVSEGVGWLDPEINTGFIDDRDQYRARFNYVWTASPSLLFSFRAAVTRSPNRRVGRFPFIGPNLAFGRDAGIKGMLSPSGPAVNVGDLGPLTSSRRDSRKLPLQ